MMSDVLGWMVLVTCGLVMVMVVEIEDRQEEANPVAGSAPLCRKPARPWYAWTSAIS